ncbi:MAG: TlpA disulfide reductase family protein [Bacteroidota bacterium]
MKSYLCFTLLLIATVNLSGQSNIDRYYALIDSVDRWQEEHILYQKAPNFKASLISGEEFDLADHKGKVVFINFWFTTCRPCIQELPDFEALHKKYANQEVSFISICLDGPAEIERLFSRIRKDMPACQVSIIARGEEIVKQYGVALFPTNMLIDQEGVVQFIGKTNLKQAERKLKKMLKS